jgi:hypothetical protein
MESRELRELQERYIQESNAFLECLRQKVSWNILDKKREKIREISRLIDEQSNRHKNPSSNTKTR